MKQTKLDPLTIKRRFAKVLGVLSSRLYLTAKDLESFDALATPENLQRILEEVATLPAKDLADLQALLDPERVERRFLLLKDWAKPFWIKVQNKMTNKETAQENLRQAMEALCFSLDALRDATESARDALEDGNACDAERIFSGALEDAQNAWQEMRQAKEALDRLTL